MAIEYYMMTRALSSNDKKKVDPKEDKGMMIAVIIYLLFWIWAMSRALACKKNKVTHTMFASISPVLYLVLSYFAKDFCN